MRIVEEQGLGIENRMSLTGQGNYGRGKASHLFVPFQPTELSIYPTLMQANPSIIIIPRDLQQREATDSIR